MKPEIKIPQDVLLYSDVFDVIIITDPFWAAFIIESKCDLKGHVTINKKLFDFNDNPYCVKKSYYSWEIMIYINGKCHFKRRDTKSRKPYWFKFKYIGEISSVKILSSNLVINHAGVSYIKSKLKY